MITSSLILSMVLVAPIWTSSLLEKRAGTCPITPLPAANRIDCGTKTTTSQSCISSGCCWNSLPLGTAGPFCYVPPDPTCPAVEATKRINCGTTSTTAAICLASGCCWNPIKSGAPGPSCFYKPTVVPPSLCPVTPLPAAQRIDCGNRNTTSVSCAASSCCWQPLPFGVPGPYCYRFASPTSSIVVPSTTSASSSISPSVTSVSTTGTPIVTLTTATSSIVVTSTTSAISSVSTSVMPVSTTVTPSVTLTTATASPTATSTLAPVCPATPLPAGQRIDCGDINTTADSCVQKGCCWNVLPPGTPGPYCYAKPIPVNPQCPNPPFPPIARKNCGDVTTTALSCIQMGCCWDALAPGTTAPNCYQSTVSAGFGTPGSDPGTKLNATTSNPGSFAVIADSPVVPLGSALVPGTNRVILLERMAGGKTGTSHSYTLDLTTNQFTAVPFDSDLFCVGGSILPDGRIFNMGGWTGDVSLRGMRFYKDGDTKWLEDPTKARLLVPRWYPSALLLPDGRVWVIGGATDMQPPGVNQPNAELVPQTAGSQVVTVPLLVQTDGSNLYPIAYVIPPDTNMNTPRMWLFSSARSQLLDLNTLATIAELPPAPPGQGQGARVYPLQGGHAMLPLIADAQNNYPPAEIIICGGGTGFSEISLAMDTCVRTTPSLGAAAVWIVEQMPSPRIFADMIALPDGTYLIVNGAGRGWSGFTTAGNPQKTALLYNPKAPVSQRFTVLASTDYARLYHSEAILALDGRVIISGSTPNYDGDVDNTQVIHPNEHRIEAFSPPYLTNGKTRPSISSFTKEASGGWNYNTLYNITATIPSAVTTKVSVTLIAHGFVTHSVHMGEKTIMPFITSVTKNPIGDLYTITIRSPRDANIAQPQFYSLWVLDDGTPSVGQWVQIGGVPAVTGPAWPF